LWGDEGQAFTFGHVELTANQVQAALDECRGVWAGFLGYWYGHIINEGRQHDTL
jgi:hypothetical protein